MNVEVTRGIKTYFIYIHTHTIDVAGDFLQIK